MTKMNTFHTELNSPGVPMDVFGELACHSQEAWLITLGQENISREIISPSHTTLNTPGNEDGTTTNEVTGFFAPIWLVWQTIPIKVKPGLSQIEIRIDFDLDILGTYPDSTEIGAYFRASLASARLTGSLDSSSPEVRVEFGSAAGRRGALVRIGLAQESTVEYDDVLLLELKSGKGATISPSGYIFRIRRINQNLVELRKNTNASFGVNTRIDSPDLIYQLHGNVIDVGNELGELYPADDIVLVSSNGFFGNLYDGTTSIFLPDSGSPSDWNSILLQRISKIDIKSFNIRMIYRDRFFEPTTRTAFSPNIPVEGIVHSKHEVNTRNGFSQDRLIHLGPSPGRDLQDPEYNLDVIFDSKQHTYYHLYTPDGKTLTTDVPYNNLIPPTTIYIDRPADFLECKLVCFIQTQIDASGVNAEFDWPGKEKTEIEWSVTSSALSLTNQVIRSDNSLKIFNAEGGTLFSQFNLSQNNLNWDSNRSTNINLNTFRRPFWSGLYSRWPGQLGRLSFINLVVPLSGFTGIADLRVNLFQASGTYFKDLFFGDNPLPTNSQIRFFVLGSSFYLTGIRT